MAWISRCHAVALALLLGGCAGGSIATGPEQPEEPVDPPPETPEEEVVSWIYLHDFEDAVEQANYEPVRLVAGDRPTWSPDGEWIAFERNDTIRVIRPDGTGEHFVIRGRQPTWSPDGAWMAFVSDVGISTILIPTGSFGPMVPHDFNRSSESDMGVGKPAWSPDGSRIAFEHLGDGDMIPAQIYVLNLDGLEIARLTSTTGMQFAESDPSWSPDGTEIVFWSYGHGLARMRAGGAPHTIYSNFPTVAYGAKPAWSPDGTQILFNANLYSESAPEIWSVGPSGGPVTVFATGSFNPSWSQDGKVVALVRNEP